MATERKTGILVFRKGKRVVLTMTRELHWNTERGARYSFTTSINCHRDNCKRIYGPGICTAELYHEGELKYSANFEV